MNSQALPIGKLDSEILKKIVFDSITFTRKEIITRPGIGEDCAVIDYGAYDCVMSTDPITAAVSDIGRLSIHISCNDIASNGIEPLGIMLVLMLPVGTTADDIAHIMHQAAEAAAQCGVEIIGGHTEITRAVTTPVIVSTAVGRGLKGQSQSAHDMRSGDRLYMTKTAGIEGTGILACDFAEEVSAFLTESELQEAQDMLNQVSVVKEGVIAGRIGTAGMHDITEGGILGAVWELCHIAGLGARVYEEQIPVAAVTKKVCAHFGIDYLRLISSGCMLMVVPQAGCAEMEQALAQAGVLFSCIGEVGEADQPLVLVSGGQTSVIAPPEADEIYKAVGRA